MLVLRKPKVILMSRDIPKIIWLQLFDEDGEELYEPSWCEDQINSNDIKYQRLSE